MNGDNTFMVSVAQLVEPRIVIPVVVGSSPIAHPIFGNSQVHMILAILFQTVFGPLAQLVEQGTLNPKVVGSTPTRPTNFLFLFAWLQALFLRELR